MKQVKCLLFLFILLLIGINGVKALEPVKCPMSEAYKEYLSLPLVKKNQLIAPNYCDFTSQYYVKGVRSTVLPSRYNARDYNYVTSIRNQEQTGTCTSFATSTILESYLKLNYERNYQFSTRHMEYLTVKNFLNGGINPIGYNRIPGDGLYYEVTSNLLMSNYAPVLESDMPFQNNEDIIALSSIQNKEVVVDVNSIKHNYGDTTDSCSDMELTNLKTQIINNGPIAVLINMAFATPYYNTKTAALYYYGSEFTNHAVTVVGWDDSYSKNNFATVPSRDGAWIVQNSYGSSFGDGGLIYVSYDDIHICNFYMAIMDADFTLPKNSYMHDYLANNVSIGYTSQTEAYAMSVFERTKTNESLDKISFYSNDAGTYKIYYKSGDASNNSILEMTEIGSGTINYAGYTTHKFNDDFVLDNNIEFSIAIYMKLNTNEYPIAFTTSDERFYSVLSGNINEGQSYVSSDGTSWTDLATYYSDYAGLGIKTFTNNIKLELSDYSVETSINSTILDLEVDFENVLLDKVGYVLKNNKNETININVTSATLTNNNLNLIFDTVLTSGSYNLQLTYLPTDLEPTISFEVYDAITSLVYSINQTNKIIRANVSGYDALTFINQLNTNKYSIYKGTTKLEEEDLVGTGMQIGDYKIAVIGDVTGDGLIKMNDVMKISKYLVDDNGLSEDYNQEAADVNDDTYIRMNDVMRLSKNIIDGGSL